MLTVAVLGPVEVYLDGRLRSIPAGRTTELLVRLAVEPRTPVSADRLIEDLWQGDAIATARNTLQSKVSQLRRALGDPARLVAAAGSYRLDVDDAALDARRVVALAAEVDGHWRHGDAGATAATAATALQAFRGPLLPGAGDGDWVLPHRARLDEVRLGLVETWLAARVELGDGGDLIGELEATVAEHPHRERLWAALITALYRAGRQADALAAGRRVRAVLLDELGVDPGPELQALERRILDHDVAPATGAAAVPTAAAARRGNVPSLHSPTIGRDAEAAELTALVAGHRLVTVVGPAGVGKTRVALDIARETVCADGPWLLRLDSLDAGAAVAAFALDVIGGASGALADRLAGSDALVVLDNCEHVIDDAAGFANAILDDAPGVRVLATSQVPFGIDGEVVVELRPLAPDAAAELFAARATRGRATDAALVGEVCRMLDGLPLAIELAAARTRSLSVDEIARRLDDRFTLLTDPSGRRPSRRGALREAIGWSYDLLFPDDQRGLGALACFGGGAPLDGAQRVAAALDVPEPVALDVFDRLVDRSLASADVDGGAVRYRLLDSIRSFALDRLDDEGLRAGAERAHATWVAELADAVGRDSRGPGQPWCVRTARVERANVDLALDWAAAHDPALGLRIALGFGWTWVVVGDGAAGAARLRAALAAVAEPSAPEAARALLLAAWLEAGAGDLALAAGDLDRATTLLDGSADALATAELDRHRAFLLVQQGHAEAGLAAAERSRAAAARLGASWHAAGAANLAAWAWIALGDTDRAREAATSAYEQRVALGDGWGQMHADAMLGRIAAADGRLDEAEERLARAAALSTELGFAGQTALHLVNLARVHQQRGADALAVEVVGRALDAAAAGGDQRIAATARLIGARSLHDLGRDDEAVAQLRLNVEWYARAGGGDGDEETAALLARLVQTSTR